MAEAAEPPNDSGLSKALRFARTSVVQAILVLLMVIAATGMAHGYGS